MVGVVFLHAYDTTVDLADGTIGVTGRNAIADLVRYVVSQELARIAVPLFFLISGYLFFYRWQVTPAGYTAKLRARLRTLLVPFLFWNLLTLAAFTVAQAWPLTAPYFSGRKMLISDYGLGDYLAALVGWGREPIAYQFWFIRDLMLLVLLVPAIHAILRIAPRLAVVVLAALWLLEAWPLGMPAAQATLFFVAGCAAAIHGLEVSIIDRFGKSLAALFVLTLITDAWFGSSGNLGPAINKLNITVGVVWMLWLSGRVLAMERHKGTLLWLSTASFFVFAAHEPLLTLLRKISFRLLQPESHGMLLVLYFALPVTVICGLVVASVVLRHTLPRLFALVTGGR